MSTETIISARNHPTFVSTFNNLIANRFCQEIDKPNLKVEIDSDDLAKSIWLASIIASSDNEDDKYRASVFAIAVFLEANEDLNIQQAAFVILSRSGNLIASRFFTDLILFDEISFAPQFNRSFGIALDIEVGAKMATNKIIQEGIHLTLSDYQKQLWSVLESSQSNIAISAPTSAGKSFIIQRYLKKKFAIEEDYKVVYIVPTRALIAQVSETLKKTLSDDVKVNTAFIENPDEDEPQFQNKEVYILTPERCLRLLQYSYVKNFSPDLLFIDEFQNIEHNDARGFLFEFLLNEVVERWGRTRIITAGPFLDNPELLFKMVFNSDCEELQTLFSPVFQLKVSVKPSILGSQFVDAKIHFQQETVRTLIIDVGFDFDKSIRNKARTVISLVPVLGKNSKNIIYYPRSDWAERFAVSLAETLLSLNIQNDNLPASIRDLIDLISEEIHPQYYLIDALRTKTAFHHGKLPEIIRGELEYLFETGVLNNIVCTSTLMEGVNLPAQKIFIGSPKKDRFTLSPLEFGNIVGRAGRIRDSLTGTVICIEDEEETWAEDNFKSSPTQKIEPAANKILAKPIDEITQAIALPLDEVPAELESAVSFLKHKFLQGDQSLDDYLTKKEVDEVNRIALIEGLQDRLAELQIPPELTRLNPSIDPELQNTLFSAIREEGIEEWVIFDNGNLFRPISKATREGLNRQDDNLYGQFEALIFKLDGIFDLNSEAFFKHQISRSVKQMVLYATKWMRNDTMKKLINDEIGWFSFIGKLDKNDRGKVNRKINEVIKIYSTIISFVLVKYLKLLSDMLNTIMNDEEKETFKMTLNLHTYLELGTLNAAVLQLISQGMSRSVAIKVGPLVPDDRKEDATTWLREQETVNLRPVYIKYLKRKGFLYEREEEV